MQAQNKSIAEVERIVEKELIAAWGHRSIRDIRRNNVLTLMDTDRLMQHTTMTDKSSLMSIVFSGRL